jgi:hypothetical protein
VLFSGQRNTSRTFYEEIRMRLAISTPLLSLPIAALFILGMPASTQTNQTSAAQPNQAPGQTPNKSAAQPAGGPANSAPAAAKPTASTGQPAPRFVNCHALEAHASSQPAVTIVVFNQRDKPDHARLSDLLKENDGASVELRTSDGKWHKATLVRLRSCFGRGLLFLAGDPGEPKDRENFLLRFPPKKIS